MAAVPNCQTACTELVWNRDLCPQRDFFAVYTAAPPYSSARRPAKAPAASKKKMPRLGWLEIVVLGQTVLPALMFVPQLTVLRFISRVASFALPMMAWGMFLISGRKTPGGRTYPPAPLLMFASAWMAVSIVNPGVNTLSSALCAVGIAVGVMCPAFWGAAAIRDPRQLGRIMILLLMCNGASALMGIAQVYRPNTFRPPKVVGLGKEGAREKALTVTTDDGHEFLRPTGLTDSPGGAAVGGQVSVAIGLALALMPVAWWKRGAGASLAFVGVAILFYSQVRVLLITLILGLMVWGLLLALRGEVRKLATLAVMGLVLGVAAGAWVFTHGGSGVMGRFAKLLNNDVVSTYNHHRGAIVAHGIQELLPRYPLGAGPGRCGMPSGLFGNPVSSPDRAPIGAETQIDTWVLDGGLPLLGAYALALALAMCSAMWTALRCPDPEIAYWAGVVVVYGVAAVSSAFGYPAFMAPAGVQFWALFAALFGAQEQARINAARERILIARGAM